MSLRVQDRLILDDGPVPTPRPVPQPVVVVPVAPPASPSWFTAANLKLFAPWVAMGLMAGVLAWQMWKGRPSPGPTPPTPQPVAIDAKIRECAANYFEGYPHWYGDVSPLVAAASPNYNEVTEGILAKRKDLGTKLGLRIDELVKPLYDESTLAFKDRAETQRVYTNIEASLTAGIKDAAARLK